MSEIPMAVVMGSIGGAMLLGGIVAGAVRRPLFNLLTDVCGTADRARFWTVFTMILLVLAPMIGPLFLASFPPKTLSWNVYLARSLFYAVVCLSAALLIAGRRIWLPIASGAIAPQRPARIDVEEDA